MLVRHGPPPTGQRSSQKVHDGNVFAAARRLYPGRAAERAAERHNATHRAGGLGRQRKWPKLEVLCPGGARGSVTAIGGRARTKMARCWPRAPQLCDLARSIARNGTVALTAVTRATNWRPNVELASLKTSGRPGSAYVSPRRTGMDTTTSAGPPRSSRSTARVPGVQMCKTDGSAPGRAASAMEAPDTSTTAHRRAHARPGIHDRSRLSIQGTWTQSDRSGANASVMAVPS
jgi:hypothetical protein